MGADPLEAAAARLSAHAPSVPLTLDLSHADAIEPVIAEALNRMHAPDEPLVLVNCAGFGAFGPFLDQPADSLESLMRVNYHAFVRTMRAALPRMVRAGRGHVFNVSSMSAPVGTWGHAGYGASKAAVRNLTETVASEFSERGVRCTTVFPGIVNTPYFQKPDLVPLWKKVRHRAIPPERVARAIGRALWSSRLEVHVPSHYSVLDWGSCAMLGATIALIRRCTRPLSEDEIAA